MFALLIWIAGTIFLLRLFGITGNTESQDRIRFVSNFILLYRQETGITLEYEQALTLIRLAAANMSRDNINAHSQASLTRQYDNAWDMVSCICAEAEAKAVRNHHSDKE